MVTTLRTFERFWTTQGTGHLVGMPQWFIRTAGCSVKCPIREVCDEPGALDLQAGKLLDVGQLADEALAEVGQGGWVHITGGEPCDQPEALTALGIELERRDLRIHLQTSGTLPIPIRTDWLTVSPKVSAAMLAWTWGQELIVVNDPAFITDDAVLRAYSVLTRFYDYYLCPLWKDGEATNAKECFDTVKRLNKTGLRWRLTGQFHKYMGVQ